MIIPDVSVFRPYLGREFRFVLPGAQTFNAVLADCTEYPGATTRRAQRMAFNLSFRVLAPLPRDFRWETVSLQLDDTMIVDQLYVERKVSDDPTAPLIEAMFS